MRLRSAESRLLWDSSRCWDRLGRLRRGEAAKGSLSQLQCSDRGSAAKAKMAKTAGGDVGSRLQPNNLWQKQVSGKAGAMLGWWCPVRPVFCRTNKPTTTDHCNAPKSSKTHTAQSTNGPFEMLKAGCRMIFVSLQGHNIFDFFLCKIFFTRFCSKNWQFCSFFSTSAKIIYFGEVIQSKLNWNSSNLFAQIPASQSVMIFAADRLTFL